MDLDRRLDRVAAALAELPIMDLCDIPAARETMLERRAVAAADASAEPDRGPAGPPGPGTERGSGRAGPSTTGRSEHPGVLPVPVLDSRRRACPGADGTGQPGHGPHRGHGGLRGGVVEWRRAPEHPFPAPMDDCYAGLAWTHKHAAELNVDPQRIAVGGASSGGGSAAGLVLLARDRRELPVFFQLLIYPMLDDRNATPASMALTDPRVWNRTSNLIGWRAYVGDAAGANRGVALRRARPREPTWPGCRPPTWRWAIWTCSSTRTSSTPSACSRLTCPTELHVYPGGSHAFES